MSSGIEEQIRRAMQEGKFDDLPGQGKPLKLEENPFEDPDVRMANHLLRSAGFTLPWIEKKREIEALSGHARRSLRQSWEWRQAALQAHSPGDFIESEWQRACAAFREQVLELNRRIQSLNLEVPHVQFQIPPIDYDRELQLTQTTASDTL